MKQEPSQSLPHAFEAVRAEKGPFGRKEGASSLASLSGLTTLTHNHMILIVIYHHMIPNVIHHHTILMVIHVHSMIFVTDHRKPQLNMRQSHDHDCDDECQWS